MIRSMSVESQEVNSSPESKFNPESLGIVLSSFYPKWYQGEVHDLNNDKIRGDLAIGAARFIQEKKYNLIVVDGGSPNSFIDRLEVENVDTKKQRGRGLSSARREGFEAFEGNSQIKVVCATEPEKISLIKDSADLCTRPILEGEADIVIPYRDRESFQTLPSYQAQEEQKSNKLYNKILRSRNILKESNPDIEFWFASHFIRNDPSVLSLFKKTYTFEASDSAGHKIVNLQQYADTLFFPIVAALKAGFRVVSIPIHYEHPAAMKEFETGRPEFDRKRDQQRRSIMIELVQFIKYLEGKRTRVRENA